MNKLIFRCHALSELMTEPKGPTNAEKYLEAVSKVNYYKNEYSLFGNKATKAAQQKLKQVQKWNNVVLGLEHLKESTNLSETCITRILKTYAQQVHGRRESIKSKYLKKGHAREEDAITLLSLITKEMYIKNTERLTNQFISGELDVFKGKEVRKAKHTLDTKCSWSYETYLNSVFKPLNASYTWQGHGYMDLSGAEQHTVAFCLVNGLLEVINDEILKLGREMKVIDVYTETDPEFLKACRQVEVNHIFDVNAFYKENPNYEFYNEVELDKKGVLHWEFDIPMEKRIHLKNFKRDEDKIKQLHARCTEANAWAQENLFAHGL